MKRRAKPSGAKPFGAKKPGAKKPGAKKPGAKKPGAKKPGRATAKAPRRAVRRPNASQAPTRAPTLSLHIGVPARSMPLPVADFEGDVLRALALAGFRGAMSLAVVSDAEMRRVNRDFHATDSATDVLAFPLVPDAPGGFDAEVIVSVDTARREARARGVAPAAELMLYVVHGTLHILGHDDHDPAKAAVMHRRTLAILAKLGHPNTIEIPGSKKQGSSE